MLKHIDIIIKNYSSKSKKYKVNSWIEYKSNKIYDLGMFDVENKIRLMPPDNKIISTI